MLRADTFLAARYAVSERHRITDDVVAVRINRIRPPSPGINEGSGALPPVELNAPEDAAQIGRLVDSFNRLYGSVTVPNVMSCPQSPPGKDTVTFSTATQGGTTDTVVAVLEPDCFGQIHMTVNGAPLHITLDPGRWHVLLNSIADAAN